MSVKYADSSGSASTCTGNSATATNANYASSAGNSDTVDGFHFKISTTDLTAIACLPDLFSIITASILSLCLLTLTA